MMTGEALIKELESLQKEVQSLNATISRLGSIRNNLSNRLARIKRDVKRQSNKQNKEKK